MRSNYCYLLEPLCLHLYPNDFFSEENMLKHADKYRASTEKSMPGFVYFGDDPAKPKGVDQYQNQQAFSIDELRQAFPDANQEKQSVELNIKPVLLESQELKLI